MKPIFRRFAASLLKAISTSKDWLIAQFVLALLSLIGLLPTQTAFRTIEKLAGFIGPKTKRHRLAMMNLAIAFPEKSEEEKHEIALEMWRGMARLAAEYVFLDEISQYDPDNPENGNIEVEGIETFIDLHDNPRPFIVFTIHSGNFELLPIIAQKYGLNVSALFRPPNNRFIAEKVFSARGAHMTDLIPSKAGAAWMLAKKLDEGKGIGMLVDQKFIKGIPTTFFGREVKTNPLLAKLVRQYNCEVFPARCIRLPEGRFRLQLDPAIEIPRNEAGNVDITATAQLLNDKVEVWAREYPGQWQWFHDRWDIKHKL